MSVTSHVRMSGFKIFKKYFQIMRNQHVMKVLQFSRFSGRDPNLFIGFSHQLEWSPQKASKAIKGGKHKKWLKLSLFRKRYYISYHWLGMKETKGTQSKYRSLIIYASL